MAPRLDVENFLQGLSRRGDVWKHGIAAVFGGEGKLKQRAAIPQVEAGANEVVAVSKTQAG